MTTKDTDTRTIQVLKVVPVSLPPFQLKKKRENVGGIELVDMATGLEVLQSAVGGYLSCLFLPESGGAHCYFNTDEENFNTDEENFNTDEESSPAPNTYATMLVNCFLPWFSPRDYLVGVVLFFGSDPVGNPTDVPRQLIAQCQALTGLPRID